ncbi:MAG: hypothetical protein U0835_22750, partial [Isosphaeraceae bacterium]
VEATAPPMAASEPARFPTPALRRMRARYLSSEQVARQERLLARLDRLNALASHEGLDRSSLKQLLGRVLGPGMPSHVPSMDGLNLLALPEKLPRPASPNAAAIASFQNILEPDAEPRPPWLEPADRWPAGIGR